MGPIFTSLSSAIDPKLLSKKKFLTTTQKKFFRNGSKNRCTSFYSSSLAVLSVQLEGVNACPSFGSDHRAPKKKDLSAKLSRERDNLD